jgi:hypothetical protein
MKVEDVVQRMKELKQWQIVTAVPEEFDFYGPVPYDMKISGGVATVTVWAVSLEEARERVNEYFAGGI